MGIFLHCYQFNKIRNIIAVLSSLIFCSLFSASYYWSASAASTTTTNTMCFMFTVCETNIKTHFLVKIRWTNSCTFCMDMMYSISFVFYNSMCSISLQTKSNTVLISILLHAKIQLQGHTVYIKIIRYFLFANFLKIHARSEINWWWFTMQQILPFPRKLIKLLYQFSF